jgi:SAM-dependent methyltransferase
MPRYVSWVPTQTEYIDTFFELCPVSPADIVYDLGSGDGRLLFTAAEKGAAKCVGIEIDTECIKASRETAKKKGLDKIITFIEADVMTVDLSEASIIMCYLLSSASAALKPKFEKELKPGTRVIMESFPVPGWKPVVVTDNNGRIFYYYIMPAETTDDYKTSVGTPAYNYYEYF